MLAALGIFSAIVNPALTLLAITVLLSIVLLNMDCYTFFAKSRYPLFAITVVPLHVIYFLAAGIGFGLGGGAYALSSLTHRSRPAGRRPPSGTLAVQTHLSATPRRRSDALLPTSLPESDSWLGPG
ncbi:MAG: hypothetical protein KF861_08060 [Planctomycetaceae bacterium]|nr:hypothetical protein [Planctomycetaceae bacterium]